MRFFVALRTENTEVGPCFFFGQGVRGFCPVVSEEMTTGLLLGRPTSVYFVSSVVDDLLFRPRNTLRTRIMRGKGEA